MVFEPTVQCIGVNRVVEEIDPVLHRDIENLEDPPEWNRKQKQQRKAAPVAGQWR